MKNKIYLPLYKRWMEHGLDGHGLCRSFQTNRMAYHTLEYTFFTKSEASYHRWEYVEPAPGQFTPLRQNIILLLAAMNNEL